ncbi:Alpha/Beta hydrolase protein [Mariannaea sp. PMI_226]|nr:Alpha/Beta hydrolase protein [Mariannaea sp. PMI_226]
MPRGMTASHPGLSQLSADSTDPHLTDPTLLKDNSEFKSYKTSKFEYPGLRIFYRQHAKADQLPKTPSPLPLLVFLHGLGGSVAQFHPLLSSLTDLAPCLAIDYPGCGRSEFSVTSWDAYTTEALVELLETIIEDYRDKLAGQRVVLIGHSMGTALSAQLANKKKPHTTSLAHYVIGLVAICPVSQPPNESMTAWARRAMWIPGWLFDLWRSWDGWGGPESASVKRFVGEDSDKASRLLQYRFNKQSRTPVWRRMANGALPLYENGKAHGGIAGLDCWAGLHIPVFLIAGEKDNVVSPKEADKIIQILDPTTESTDVDSEDESSKTIVDSAAQVNVSAKLADHVPSAIEDLRAEDFGRPKTPQTEADENQEDPTTPRDPSTPRESLTELPSQPNHPHKVVRSITLPAPANHALLYTPCSVRAVAGVISDFLATNITGRLSLAWQLQYLSREGKWDVKNLNKWKSVNPVSEPIGPADNPVFRAMKTLREADDVHCPAEFTAKWGDVVKDVIDISKDQPVYDPRGLERAGIHYHKFPTVSKIPPSAAEVDAFIRLVDDLRSRQPARAAKEGWEKPEQCVVGVHCHYGFNRTGYFIVCYLVERCGYEVQQAIDAFAKARPNGIRHSHFLDRLCVRYNIDAVSHP